MLRGTTYSADSRQISYRQAAAVSDCALVSGFIIHSSRCRLLNLLYMYSNSKCWPGWRGVKLDLSGPSLALDVFTHTHTLELESVRVLGQAQCRVPGAV